MAYAYPSGAGPNSSSSSLVNAPGHHAGMHRPHHERASASISRKGSDESFDLLREFKLKIEEDNNYLQFFQDRIRVEEEYIAGLKRAYSRSKAIDTLHDDAFRREEKPTSRQAWDEVRDYTQREIQAKEALVGALKEVIVKELIRLREEQTRIRMGLKENMKYANEMYDEHAKNQLPKIKRNYWQKCQALEDHRRQEHAIAMQAKLLADSPTSPLGTPLREHPNAFSIAPPTNTFSPPIATAPLPPASNPVMAPSAASETFSPEKKGLRLRAGSASAQGDAKTKDMFNDIAAHSKKGFNAIMQKLGGDKADKEESGFVVVPPMNDEGLQRRGTARGDPARGMGTMRGVKVKRDADEADKTYRLSVFHLESLRLRRDKLQSSGVKNLEAFNDDLNKTLLMAMGVYVDTLHGTAATQAQSTHVARSAIEQINLDKDTSLFRTRLRAVDLQRALPVPYHNFYVGECRSLIFGVSLTDYDFARGEGTDHGRPPVIVEKCLAALDEKGLDAEGIYRISGRHAGVQKMIQDIELDEEKFMFGENDDVFSISNVLKQYLRELPEPVFHFPQPERVKYTENRETHIHSNFSALRGRLRRLAPIHQTTFQAIVEHLSRVAAQSSVNKMDAKNLAVVFNSVLFGQDQIMNDASLLTMANEKDALLEDLINYSDLLFGTDDTPQAPSLFPPGAALSRSGVISYHPVQDGPQPGSSRTKFKVRHAEDTNATPPVRLNSPSEPEPGDRPTDKDIDKDATPKIEASPFGFDSFMPVPTFTPDKELELLFDASLVPSQLRQDLGEDLHVRPLASTDLMRSHFGLLQTLTDSPPIAPSMYTHIFDQLKSLKDTYFILAVIDKKTDQMVAHGALIVEKKYIHAGGSAGHIEDIVVGEECRGQGVGKKLVMGLRDLAMARGCYKVCLSCKDDKIAFYEKCGFHARSRGMAYYKPTSTSIVNETSPSASRPPPNAFNAPYQAPLPRDAEPHGSPTTIISDSSVGGVTYSFPVGTSSISPAGQPAPPLPPRPIHSPLVLSPEVTSPKLDLPANLLSTDSGSSADAPTVPHWASEGLGNAEKTVATPSTPDASADNVLGVGMTGLSVKQEASSSRAVSPLPPGAAPPHPTEEPERIVEARG